MFDFRLLTPREHKNCTCFIVDWAPILAEYILKSCMLNFTTPDSAEATNGDRISEEKTQRNCNCDYTNQ